MTTTEPRTRVWTFVLIRELGTEVMADGVVFADDGTTVLHWRDASASDSAGTLTLATLRQVIERYCHRDAVQFVWTSGGPAAEGDGMRTDSLCLSCYAPMLEVPMDHDVIRTEGRCPDCGTREVWMLNP